jgi:hypothetical protein
MRSLQKAGVVALVGFAVLGPTLTAHATIPTTNKADVGLFGASDPSFDGAFRQSLGLLAEHTAGVRDAAAIGWLVAQQCPDGGWTAYRKDLAKPCPATDLTSFTGEDSNSTALAVQALHALGVTPRYDAVAFLHTLQDSDGGFPLIKGSGTDPNSTGLVVQAIDAIGQDPAGSAWTSGGKTPVDALMSFWLGCGSSDPGAFSSPFSSGHGDLIATVQAVWGAAGKPFPITSAPTTTQPTPTCPGSTPIPADAAADAATWLAGKLQGGGYLTTGSSPDYSLTAQGVLAMAATATNKTAATSALGYLATHVSEAVVDAKGVLSAGSIGYLALAAHSVGQDPTSFGGRDLIAALASIRRALPTTAPVTKPVTKPVTQPVTAPAATGSGALTLPVTGTTVAVQAGLAADLVFVGGLLMVAGRRRAARG